MDYRVPDGIHVLNGIDILRHILIITIFSRVSLKTTKIDWVVPTFAAEGIRAILRNGLVLSLIVNVSRILLLGISLALRDDNKVYNRTVKIEV